MIDVKKLLSEAAPRPWRSVRGYGPDKFMPKGYRYVQFGPTEAKADGRGTDQLAPADADLIVYAVNRLPDYEAAIDALDALLREVYEPVSSRADGDGPLEYDELTYEPSAEACRTAALALARLRETREATAV